MIENWNELYLKVIIEGIQTVNELFRPYYKFLFLFILLRLFPIFPKFFRKRKARRKMQQLLHEGSKLTVKEFQKLPSQQFLKQTMESDSNPFHLTGIYILHNRSKDLYYVGQSKNVFKRIKEHLRGKGNVDLYADYKYKDDFSIQTIGLKESSYSNLDDLERHAIEKFHADKKGYNKNRGNAS